MGEESRQLPCKHLYLHGYIMPWLKMHCSCSVCQFRCPWRKRGVAVGAANRSRSRPERMWEFINNCGACIVCCLWGPTLGVLCLESMFSCYEIASRCCRKRWSNPWEQLEVFFCRSEYLSAMFFLASENIFQCGQGILFHLPAYPSQSEHLLVVSLDYLAY